MKNIINSILILLLFLSMPIKTFADDNVLKTFSAPTKTVKTFTTVSNKQQTKATQAQKTVSKATNQSQTQDLKPTPVPIIPISATQPTVEFIYKESSRWINSIDPSVATGANSYFPGLRGTNQLVIYTPQYGLRTGTNEFGTEAIVLDNTVTQLNGADSLIPSNGFVISGHGAAKKWINENITVGSKIFVDLPNNKIRTYVTPESLIFAAKSRIKEANSLMEYYRNQDILYDDKRALTYINKAKDLLRKAERNPDNAQVYISEAMEAANQAIKNAIPYKEDELKGVWIRPTETTPDEIIKTIDKIHSAGINNIFLETYFHGKTIYPSKVLTDYNVTNQREEFVGFDPLRVWVDECHKRNMKVNIWFETFYVGNQNPNGNSKHVLNAYPSWANTTKAGYNSNTPVASLSEHNGYFIDPANPEVQAYLLALLKEIINNYHPDGINLDYIRYPQSIAAKFSSYDLSNWGYTNYARAEFKNSYGVDPLDIKYGNDAWDLWATYRQNKITNFVKSVRDLTKSNNVLLTTVIFPDRKKALETKMQDWRSWSVQNIVDGFTPLILTSDQNTASSMIQDIKSNSNPCTKIYAGLFVTFMGGSFDDLLMQIQESRKIGTKGVILFDYAHLAPEYVDALQARVFKPIVEQATSPTYNYSDNCQNNIKKNKKRKKCR